LEGGGLFTTEDAEGAKIRTRPPTIAADHCGSGARPTQMNANSDFEKSF